MIRERNGGVWRRLKSRLIASWRGPTSGSAWNVARLECHEATAPREGRGEAPDWTDGQDAAVRQRAAFSQQINC